MNYHLSKLFQLRITGKHAFNSIKDGVLTIEPINKAYMFELTLLYNNEHKDFDWFLLSFEYKLEKITKLEKVDIPEDLRFYNPF